MYFGVVSVLDQSEGLATVVAAKLNSCPLLSVRWGGEELEHLYNRLKTAAVRL